MAEAASTVLSVSELNRLARQSIERELPLLWVSGEISNLTRAASGHVYFSLKDEAAQVRCVMFRSRAQLVPWQLANGQQVEVRALPSLYEARGEFQLGVETLRRAGLGRLYEAFARLRARLEAEGLFDAARKRALPRFPRHIGIVTSLQAAALQDVLAAIRRRAPGIALTVCPTPVQGEGAAQRIAEAIGRASAAAQIDLVLLVRGGGSIEDLWAFNEETVARAVAAARCPVISGVGHETDTTIADFAADLRAATPTAAAEIATQGWVDAAAELARVRQALARGLGRRLHQLGQRVDDLSRRLVHPAMRLARSRLQLEQLAHRLRSAGQRTLADRRHRLLRAQARAAQARPRSERLHGQLQALAMRLRLQGRQQIDAAAQRLALAAGALAHLDPQATVARGYAIVRDTAGGIITDASRLQHGDRVHLQLAAGSASATIESTMSAPTSSAGFASADKPD